MEFCKLIPFWAEHEFIATRDHLICKHCGLQITGGQTAVVNSYFAWPDDIPEYNEEEVIRCVADTLNATPDYNWRNKKIKNLFFKKAKNQNI